jgi:muramoyltetrapeptide carboxypeptidase
MAAADLARGLSEAEERSFLDALAGRVARTVSVAGWLRQGPAEGPLLGGCLSLLASVQGTPWAPDLAGAILFWEDVEEPLYRLDRMLTHLGLSGSLAAIRGMAIGHCRPTDAEPVAEAGGRAWLAEALAGHEWPVAWGLPAGHEAPNLTLPLGAPARLDPSSGALVVG